MHHQIVDGWSRGRSVVHNRDARAKIIALLAFLIAVATTRGNEFLALALDLILLVIGILLARLPLLRLLLRGCSILPFSLTFAAVSLLAGDTIRALGLVEKTYLSALAVLLVVSTTPLPVFLEGLHSLGVPRLLVTIVQFLYRYLFVISEQAQHMLSAARARQGLGKGRRSKFSAASGALAVLFARSYERAEGVQQAMAARGYRGTLQMAARKRFSISDACFIGFVCLLVIMVRLP